MTDAEQNIAECIEALNAARAALYAAQNYSEEMYDCLSIYREAGLALEHARAMVSDSE